MKIRYLLIAIFEPIILCYGTEESIIVGRYHGIFENKIQAMVHIERSEETPEHGWEIKEIYISE